MGVNDYLLSGVILQVVPFLGISGHEKRPRFARLGQCHLHLFDLPLSRPTPLSDVPDLVGRSSAERGVFRGFKVIL